MGGGGGCFFFYKKTPPPPPKEKVSRRGLEPPAQGFSVPCSNQLSYPNPLYSRRGADPSYCFNLYFALVFLFGAFAVFYTGVFFSCSFLQKTPERTLLGDPDLQRTIKRTMTTPLCV